MLETTTLADLAIGPCLNDCAPWARVYETPCGLECEVCEAQHAVCIHCPADNTELVLKREGEACELHATMCVECGDTAEDRRRLALACVLPWSDPERLLALYLPLYAHPDGLCCRRCIPAGGEILMMDDCARWATTEAA